MIISKVPTPSWLYRTSFTPPLDRTHIWDLSEDNIRIFYITLFKNRTDRNELYIDKYNSIKELEEDIYNECTHQYTYTTTPFKEIYNNFNKEEFLDKINTMIEEYGNAIIADIDICVKTDDLPVRLMELYNKL